MDIKEYISSGIIEAYVMGLCSEQEKQELESMRLQYSELNNAIVQFEIELENQFVNNPSATSINLDKKILANFETKQTPVIPIQQSSTQFSKWLKPIAAASILLLFSSAAFNYILFNKNKKQQELLANQSKEISLPQSDYDILKNPAITPVAMMGVGIHSICRCTMFWDKATGKAYIMVHHLMPTNAENNYQLWANVNGKSVSVGLVNEKIRDRFIQVANIPTGATSFSVTLEKAGGSTTPTEEETYLVGRI